MGVMQRSLGPMAGGVSPLRTHFMVSLIALCLIWSILSMDITRARSSVEPVYTEVVDTMKQAAEDEAIRLALGLNSPDKSEPSDSKDNSVVFEVPAETAESSSNALELPKEDNQEAKAETETGNEVSATIPESTLSHIDQAPQEAEKNTTSSPLPLVLYAYSESATARPNLEFFIRHALNDAADFVFILNGPIDAAAIIPNLPNIRIVQRDNDCYDLGAYAEVLQRDNLRRGYSKFIMLNASLRGPFMPYWSDTCWMDMYLKKLTGDVKLVGMTANCWPTFHVQSMIWATDSIDLSTLLFPPEHAIQYLNEHPVRIPPAKNKERLPSTSAALIPSTLATRSDADLKTDSNTDPNPHSTPYSGSNLPGPANHHGKLAPETSRYLPSIHQSPGINACFHTWDSAVAAEVSSTSLIKAAGYKVDVLMATYHGVKELERGESCEENGDVLWEGGYFGGEISVWETGWWKTNREEGVGMEEVERVSGWVGERGYRSWDFCRA